MDENIQAVFCTVTTLGFHAFIYKHCSSMHSRVQSFSWDNLSTGHEQFKRGSVTGSEVRGRTQRAAPDQLMSAGLPLSCATAIWAGTDSSSARNIRRDTSRSSGILNGNVRDQKQACKKVNCTETREGTSWSPHIQLSHIKISAHSFQESVIWGCSATQAAFTRVLHNIIQLKHSTF